MITKEQWEDIEKRLSGIYGHVELKLDDKKIGIAKELIAENKLGLVVYIDGSFTLGWGMPSSELFNPIVEQLWHKRTKSYYSSREKTSLIKIWGKREVKKHHDLDKKQTWYEPMFNKFSVLKSQFKKIENLEVIKIGY